MGSEMNHPLCAQAVLILAQATETAAAAPQKNVIIKFLDDGGGMMYIILFVSLMGTLMFLERAINLYLVRRLNAKAFIAKIVDHINHRRIREALDTCEISSKHPLVAVMKAGLLRANRREKEVERAMEDQMLSAVTDVQKRVDLMALLANVATLLGLLGTIVGLIEAFNSLVNASAAEKQQALAAGISTAMYTTAFGVSVAIPLLFFQHVLAKRSEKILVEVESGATSLMVAMAGQASQQDGQVGNTKTP